MKKPTAKNDIFIYPNPATNQLSIINYQLSIEEIEIYDVVGKRFFLNLKSKIPNLN